jgi:hypothetical protein
VHHARLLQDTLCIQVKPIQAGGFAHGQNRPRGRQKSPEKLSRERRPFWGVHPAARSTAASASGRPVAKSGAPSVSSAPRVTAGTERTATSRCTCSGAHACLHLFRTQKTEREWKLLVWDAWWWVPLMHTGRARPQASQGALRKPLGPINVF